MSEIDRFIDQPVNWLRATGPESDVVISSRLRMARNLALTGGLVHSEGLLLTLVAKGLKRQEAYVLVQRAALAAAEGRGAFEANLLADADVRARLTEDEIRAAFQVEHHLRWADTLFERRTKNGKA